MLFDSPAVDHAYDRWQEPSAEHEECGCLDICHEWHVDEDIFVKGCHACDEALCEICKGGGYTTDPEGKESDCALCGATGRID